ncbi:MAG TPA: TMEM14 family protein [Planctomycetota bacterium]|nr:TMEM14 family protein [Planctomycetota bacterium]
MTTGTKALISALYGFWLAAAGIMRFVQAGSKPALGFGLTTGVMALLGAALFMKGKSRAATILIAITLVFVVCFFVSKSMKDGVDVRVGLILASSVLEAIILILPVTAPPSDQQQG